MRAFALAGLIAATVIGPALAQSGALPSNRAEQIIRQRNRAMSDEQAYRGQMQQQQFELNQLRNQIDRNRLTPTAPAARPGCPPGSIGC